MTNDKLKNALQNCLISFDRLILVTDLLQEYALPYSEVKETLEEHLQQQEQEHGTKYEKRFLVHGVAEEDEGHKEIYTVVQGEQKLKVWLAKLKNAESSLYSVEVAGGAKVPAQIFKPMQHCEVQLKKLELRTGAAKPNGNAADAALVKVKTKPETKPDAKKLTPFAAVAKKSTEPSSAATAASPSKELHKSPPTSKKSPLESKKSPLESKKSPPEDKKTTQKSSANSNKKGIGSFFAAATKVKDEPKKDEPKKDAQATGVVKPPTPKKMQDFFKKQSEKTPIKPLEKEKANTSMQLFAADDEDDVVEQHEDSSEDEEAQIDALKRDIITSDIEEEAASTSTASKRRRILDSDDEDEEPQQKLDKKEPTEEDVKEELVEVEDEPAPASETFLDDEGFIITVKQKKKPSPTVKPKAKLTKTTSKKTTPPSKSPSKSAAKAQGKVEAKTKQGNIMSFFTKK